MKMLVATSLAAALLAGSSMGMAVEKGKKDSATQNMNQDQTNSVTRDTKLSPEQIEKCKTAPPDDPTCVGAPKQ
ncbi:hypothetical protein [Rhizobium sp. LjRoot254]|uniref:hypothetical protein n=1 Tax=Rhizobium sp. LjRoot254 TaxID=3342297 RepID=UPI003ECD31A9